MDTTLLIVVIVAAVVVVAIVAALAVKANRRKQLQSRFGPEYERAIEQEGSKRKAERQLHERAETRDQFDLRDLTPAERERYREEWRGLQASFVDRPESSLADADRLVAAVMRDRGYPVDDFEQRADLVSVDHPQVVQHYRGAHQVFERSRVDDVTTEDQRRAIVMGEDHRIKIDGWTHKIVNDLELLLSTNLIHKHMHRHGTITHQHLHTHDSDHLHEHTG